MPCRETLLQNGKLSSQIQSRFVRRCQFITARVRKEPLSQQNIYGAWNLGANVIPSKQAASVFILSAS